MQGWAGELKARERGPCISQRLQLGDLPIRGNRGSKYIACSLALRSWHGTLWHPAGCSHALAVVLAEAAAGALLHKRALHGALQQGEGVERGGGEGLSMLAGHPGGGPSALAELIWQPAGEAMHAQNS